MHPHARRPGRRTWTAGLAAAALMLAAACSSAPASTSGDDTSAPSFASGGQTGSATGAPAASGTAGQTGPAVAKSPRESQDKVVLIARQDPGTLDYVKSNLTALRLWIPANVVEPLVYFDKDGTAQPGVAEKWDISDDKLTYTFHIRDTTFSDGSPVTADDVVYSLQTMSQSPVVSNAAAFEAVTDIAKTDDKTVTVTLSHPSQAFWHGMGSMAGLIQPKAAAGDIATKPIGTGPYKLVEYVSNDHLVFTANDKYWGDQPAIKDVEVRIITDGTAALNAMQAGEADSFPVITIDLWERLTKDGFDKKFKLITFPQVGEPTYAVINSKIPLEERQTIAKVFDRQALNDAYGAPWGAENTCTFALPNRSYYAPENEQTCPYPFDLDAATAEVAEKGYADSPLEFASLSDVPDLSLPADLMIPEMQAAGFQVNRNAIDLARYSQLIFQGKPPQFDVTVMSGSDDPTAFVCTDPAKAGWTTYCSADYSKAMADADAATTEEGYQENMAKAADILRKDAVIVPLIAKKGVGLFHPDLAGFTEPRVAVAIEFASLHW
jgi:peptide/nickel transport system substrate-binding protein